MAKGDCWRGTHLEVAARVGARTSLAVEPTREEEEEKQRHAQDDGEGNCGRRHHHLSFGAGQRAQQRLRIGNVALWALEAHRVAV